MTVTDPSGNVSTTTAIVTVITIEWTLNEYYERGSIISYNGSIYECTQTHTAFSPYWNPQDAPSLWKLAASCSDDGEWHLMRDYEVGDIVNYEGNSYRCLQSHTAYSPDWNPQDAPALWELISQGGGTDEWVLMGSYQAGDIVSYEGSNYECLVTHTAYSPYWNPASALSLWKSN